MHNLAYPCRFQIQTSMLIFEIFNKSNTHMSLMPVSIRIKHCIRPGKCSSYIIVTLDIKSQMARVRQSWTLPHPNN